MMESNTKSEIGESSSNSSLPNNYNGGKTVIVRVKRKADHSPLEAFWLEINERPVKRPLIDFQKLSISSSSAQEELKVKRVFVQHVETVGSSKDSIQFLQSFVQPASDGDSKFRASFKERRRTLQRENIHDRLLSRAKKEQEDLAKSARFEQLWKHRARDKEASHDESLDEVCRVYDVLRVDEETSSIVEKEEISVEDQEMLSKFLPLLKEFVPDAAEDIETDINASASKKDSADGYVYDLYAVSEKIDETEASYPFPLVQVDDDDEFFDGLEDSDYETDDSNAENHPYNDYPEEESSDEEKSSNSGSESDEEEEQSEEEDNASTKSKDSIGHSRSEDQLYDDEMDDYGRHYTDCSDDGGDDEDWKWGYR